MRREEEIEPPPPPPFSPLQSPVTSQPLIVRACRQLGHSLPTLWRLNIPSHHTEINTMKTPPPPPPPPSLASLVIIMLVLLGSVNTGCQLQCSATYVEDCEHCHTVTVKQCDITIKKMVVPVKVRKCSPAKLTSFDGVPCVDGARTRCKVR